MGYFTIPWLQSCGQGWVASALPSPTSASWGLPATSCAARGPIHPPIWWVCTMELPPPSALDSSVSPTLDPSCSPQQRVWEGEQIEQRESLLHNHGDPLLSSPAPFLVPRPLPESFSSAFGTLRSATTHLASVLLPSPPRPSLFSLTMAGVGGSVRCSRCGAQRFAAVASCVSLAQQRPALVQPPGATLGNRRL